MHKLTLATLPILVTSLLAQGTPEIEPNGAFTTATPLALSSQGDGVIGAPADFDFWKVTLPSYSDLRFWVNPGIGTSLVNSDLALIASDGSTVLAFNDDAVSPASWLSAIVTANLAPGDYYLRVRSSQNLDPNGTGSYTIDVIAAPPGTYIVVGGGGPGIPTPVAESAENNDPRQAGGFATPSFENSLNLGDLSTATAGTGYADPGADYDFFEINLTRKGMLKMETLATATSPAATDTVVFLADATLAPLAFDDDNGSGQLSLLMYYVLPGTYYVVVKGSTAGTGTGNYELDLLLTPMAPPGAASITVRPGGCGPTLGVRSTALPGPVVQTEAPVLGAAFYLDGENMPANALVIHVIGTDPLSPPYDLGPLGAPGCILEVDPIDQSLAVANASGTDYWGLTFLPLELGLIGLTVEQQIAVLDPLANPFGMTVTNRVSSVCGIHN